MHTGAALSRKKRVLLVYVTTSDSVFAASPYIKLSNFPQLGLLYLASLLREAGYEPQYIDVSIGDITTAQIAASASRDDVLFVGFYSNVAFRDDICTRIEAIRNRSKVPVVVGGPGFVEAIHYFNAGANAIVAGEAEDFIVEIARRIEDGRSLGGLPGVLLPGEGTGEDMEVAPPTRNLDALPRPAWDLAPPRLFVNKLGLFNRHPFYTMTASRGCHSRCAFCFQIYRDSSDRRYRIRSVDNVIDEMVALHRAYKIKHIRFQDEAFGANRDWMEDFCRRLIAEKLPVTWNCSLYPWFFQKNAEPMLKLIRRSGCVCIHFGLQSATPEILKRVHRSPKEPAILMEIIPKMKRMGFYTIVDFIYGLPGETEETMRNNLRFAIACKTHMAQSSALKLGPRIPIYAEYGDNPVCDLTDEQINAGIARARRAFFARPKIHIETLAYILRHNPAFLASLIEVIPFGARLALSKPRSDTWKYTRPFYRQEQN